MVALAAERVLTVKHWNSTLFSFTTTRNTGLRFENGHFVMVGLEVNGKPLLRAYSIASANHADHLEFFSIKVPDGPLTSRLQHLRPGDTVLVSNKPTGTLVIRDLHPGKSLYMLASGTGLAPFLSLVHDPEVFERFEKVILVHGVRNVADLAYRSYLEAELPRHDLLGEMVRKQLIYYPTATREPFVNNGRLTEIIQSGKLFADIGVPPMSPLQDRAMICGGPAMLKDTSALLDSMGFRLSPHTGALGDYVIERAFVEK